jgi:uncharacterized protein (TIGR03790 family)
MLIKNSIAILFVATCCTAGFALEPNEILVITNSDIRASVQVGEYYCRKRAVPAANILALPLGAGLDYTISRSDYDKKIAVPIREKLHSAEFIGKIKCLLTTYGVPVRVEGRGPLIDQQEKLTRLQQQAEQKQAEINRLQTEQNPTPQSANQRQAAERELIRLQSEIDRIIGKETDASVDSELSMIFVENYDLYRWQLNKLRNDLLGISFDVMMVSRLDGPSPEIAKDLVYKAVTAEEIGLNGEVCIDSRGIADDKKPYSYGHFDQSLRDLAVLTKLMTKLDVKQENTENLFGPGTCPRTAIYCGWYSLKQYVDAFDFVDGAIGYHISSLEAVDLRDPNSTQWCPAMLVHGITATIGAVAEPYLASFPEPKSFFIELYKGRCLVEAYYYTAPFNSWQLVLIGDPLYRPFKSVKPAVSAARRPLASLPNPPPEQTILCGGSGETGKTDKTHLQ